MNQIDESKIKLLQSEGCFAYLDSRTDDAMRRILARREEFERVLSHKAAEQMKSRLSQRLIWLHQDVLFELLLKEIKKVPGDDDSPNHIRDAASRLGERLLRTLGAEAYEEAPLLAETEQRITEHFISAQTEFLTRFCEKRETISEKLFGGKPVTVIRFLHHWGTPRWQGRMTVGIETDAGTCYYKPRDCRIDAFYHHLVNTWFSDALKAPFAVMGDGYGFCSEIVPDPVTDPRDAALFVRNLGILLALFTCLNGNDLRESNIIPCGIFPTVIDMETLFAPQLNKSEAHTCTKAEQIIWSSAVCTALLFQWNSKKDKTVTLFNEMEILPDTLSVSKCEELLIRGFREGYFRILKIRGELKEDIRNRGDMMIRVLCGNRNRNQLIAEKSFSAPCLKSREKVKKLAAHSSKSYQGMEQESVEKLFRYDLACFMDSEVPVCSARIRDRALYGKDDTDLIAEEMLAQSPLERLQERLSRMSTEECAMNEEIIRRVARREAKGPWHVPGSDYSWEIYRTLMENAFRAPDGTIWWYSQSALGEGEQKNCLCFLQADAAVYCAALLHKGRPDLYGSSNALRDVRNTCLAAIGEKISRWENVDARLELPAGLLQGVGGLLLDLALLERLGCGDASAITDRLLRLLSRENAYSASFSGLMNGVAGLLTALCAVPVRKGTETEILRLRHVRTAADVLLSTLRQPEKKNMLIRNPDPFIGIVGIGMALAMAAETLKEEPMSEAYADMGVHLIAEARENRYAEGTGLCAAVAMGYCKSLAASAGLLQQCLDWAIKASSCRDQPAPDDTLYHGNALRALFWQMTGSIKDRPEYQEKAAKIIDEIESRGMQALRVFDATILKGEPGPGLLVIMLGKQ